MKLKISKATEADIRHVALNMRDSDYREFAALTHAESREELARLMSQRYAERTDVLVGALDEPICIGAAMEHRPNVVSLMFFATERFPEIGVGITRFIRKELFTKLRNAGVHRIETIAIADHFAGRRWLETLGLKKETGPLHGYGRHKEKFIQFAWVADECS